MSSSDSDADLSPKTKHSTSAKSKHRSHDSSDSDFVKEPKRVKEKQAQNKDLSAFQKMLMGSNTKFMDIFKNNDVNTNKSSHQLPINNKKLKTSDSSEKKSKLNSFTQFSPVASSTQLPDTSFNVESAKKVKRKHTETLSDSDSDTNKRSSHKSKPQKEMASYSSNSEKNNSFSVESGKKAKKKHKETVSNSDSDVNRKSKTHKNKIDASKHTTKLQKEMASDGSDSEKNIRKRAVSSSESDSSDSGGNQKKLVKKNKSGSARFSKGDSREEAAKVPSRKNHRISETKSTSSESEEKIRKKPKKKPKSNFSEDVPIRSRQNHSKHSDSEDSHMEFSTSKAQTQLRKYESENESFSKVPQQLDGIKTAALKKEIFLIQIPKSLEPKSLEGRKVSLNEKTRVTASGRKYDCIPQATQNPVTLSFNTENIHVIQPLGSLKIQRYVKMKQVPDFPSVTWHNHVEFPTALKERHPLFGSDYEDKINLEQHIQQKLKAAIEAHGKQEKKMKKHKEEVNEEAQEEEIFKFLSQSSSKEKESKPKKHSESFEEHEATSKKKKMKKEKHSSISETDIQVDYVDSAFKQPKKKHKHKHRHEDSDTQESSSFLGESVEDSKHSKKIKQEPVDSDNSPKKKKKKKHHNDVDADDCFNLVDQMLLNF